MQIVVTADDLAAGILGDEFNRPLATVLLNPPDAESWNNIRRHVLLRIRVAAIGVVIGEARIEAAGKLHAEIEAELQNPI